MSKEKITFTRPTGEPLPPEAFLSLNHRGKYILRISISKDPRFIGERVTIPLRTTDPSVALLKRDTLIEGFKCAGILSREIGIHEDVRQNSALSE